jgi:hypothetical protein
MNFSKVPGNVSCYGAGYTKVYLHQAMQLFSKTMGPELLNAGF